MRPKRPHAAFGHRHRPVSWTPSKIPYGGFSPVRLQATAFQRVPSDLSFEPSFADFGSLHAAARSLASHPGLASGHFVGRAFGGFRHRMPVHPRLDGRTGNLPTPGLSPGRTRQVSWLHIGILKANPGLTGPLNNILWDAIGAVNGKGTCLDDARVWKMQYKGFYRTLKP
jgi:hypothetical protein